MALIQPLKNKIAKALEKTLRKYSVTEIKKEWPDFLCDCYGIFWDFKIKLGLHDITLLLEVECKQQFPAHNLIKALMWCDDGNNRNRHIIFLHVFDEAYSAEGKKPHKEMCEFVWQNIKHKFTLLTYKQISISGLSDANHAKPKFSQKKVVNTITNVAENLIKVKKDIIENRG